MNTTSDSETWKKLESILDENTVNLIEELTQLLSEFPAPVISLAVQELYQKTLAEGPSN